MFKTIKGFIAAFFSVPLGWRMWIVLLILVNMIIPVLLFERPEAQITLIYFMGSFVIGLILFGYQGFTRLQGLAHFPWFLLIYYLLGVIGQTSSNSFPGIWVRSVVLLNSVSLCLDVCDAFRYVSGERESTIGL